MEIYKKLQACKLAIKSTKMKKGGHNQFSKFDYFTPDQVEKLVFDACNENGLVTCFDLLRDEHGIKGILRVIDIDNDEVIEFQMASAMPQITATNATQQLGGAMTYTERYLKMTAFGITDNSLDFDSNSGKPEKKHDLIVIEEITDKFLQNWSSGEIFEGNIVELKGKKYQLSDKANKQLRDYLELIEEQIKKQL